MLKKTLHWAANVLVTVLLIAMVVLVFFSVSSKFSGDGTSKFGSYKMLVVLSGSMSPYFNAGDVIIDSTEKKAQYNVGDVITFKDPEDPKKIITHRIIEVVHDGDKLSYHTKGDANNSADPKPIPASNVIGNQKWNIPYFGRVVEFAKTKQGLALLVILPGLLIIAGEFKNLVKVIAEESISNNEREVVSGQWKRE